MARPTLALVIALMMPAVSDALAAEADKKYEQLQRTLEENFAPAPPPSKTRSLAPSAPAPAAPTEKQDFQWIKPKTDGAPSKTDEKKKSDAGSTWFGSIFSSFSGSSRGPENELGPARILQAGTTTPGAAKTRSLTPATDISGMQQVAQAEVPIAKKNSYVVQLKPSANQKEISALLKKYNLTVTKLIAQLGVMTVEVQDPLQQPSGGGPGAPSATRSLAKPEEQPPPIPRRSSTRFSSRR